MNTYADGIKVLFTIFILYKNYKPLKFFATFGALLAIVGLGLFIPVFGEYLKTGLVPRLPTIVVSVVMMLAAFLSFVCGLILDTENQKDKQFFELQMNLFQILYSKK